MHGEKIEIEAKVQNLTKQLSASEKVNATLSANNEEMLKRSMNLKKEFDILQTKIVELEKYAEKNFALEKGRRTSASKGCST